jgi:CDP-glucose 4,6-dehydratase
MNPQFWRGKKVFLTGHTGFKGSWLSLWLARLGVAVTGYSLAPTEDRPSLFELARIKSTMHASIFGDIRDAVQLKKHLKLAQPEIVLHLAAQALVRESYHTPAETFATNVMGTVNLLEAVRETPSVQVCLNVTTDKCYQNQEWIWGYRENDRLGGADPYSASKACSELVSASYRQSFFVTPNTARIATARAGNVIGGGDYSTDRLVPDAIRAATSGTILSIRNPNAIRPWQHVLDPIHGYLELASQLFEHRPGTEDAWNFGPSLTEQLPVSGLLDVLQSHLGRSFAWEASKDNHPHETHQLRIDATKARQQLGWSPKLDINRAIEWTASWYKIWMAEKTDMKAFTEQQIEEYESLSPIR